MNEVQGNGYPPVGDGTNGAEAASGRETDGAFARGAEAVGTDSPSAEERGAAAVAGAEAERLRLSIPVGMLLENCRSGGFSDDEIVGILSSRDYSALPARVREPEMEFAERFATAEEMNEDWERALREGYAFKFLHIGALRRLLHFRHGLAVERDYAQDELDLRGVPLTPDQAAELQATIVRQWAVEPETGEDARPGTYRIGLKFRD